MMEIQSFCTLRFNWTEKQQPGYPTPKSSRFRDRMPASSTRNPKLGNKIQMMTIQKKNNRKTSVAPALLAVLAFGWIPGIVQQAATRDPADAFFVDGCEAGDWLRARCHRGEIQ